MKVNVGLLFGGRSLEHEVSIRSAKAIEEHLDPRRYQVTAIKIEKEGPFFLSDHLEIIEHHLDIIFPVLHGPNGEDGTLQGMLELLQIPYVGPGVLSSALCMDKAAMKDRLKGGGLPVPDYLSLRASDQISEEEIFQRFSFPFFVKPAGQGSSLGISKVHRREEFYPALEKGFSYDERLLIEEGIVGREIELAVIGNLHPIPSLPGEVISTHDFYSYEAKYLDAKGAQFILPAQLSAREIQEIQEIGKSAYELMRCEGMARVDFFLSQKGTLYLNELNTIPGFTKSSLFPKLWEISGLSFQELLTQLIDLGFERFERRRALEGLHGALL